MKLLFSTIILAGGRSARMGEDKALLSIDGLSLLERTVMQSTNSGSASVIVVTAWPDRYQALPGLEECQWVQEESPQSPLQAFYTGLFVVTTPWVLLLACDLPFLSSRSLSNWAQQLPKLSLETLAFLPRTNYWEPLCGFYRVNCQQTLAAYLKTTDRSFQVWLASIKVQAIPNINPEELFNCNTPAEFAQIKTMQPSNRAQQTVKYTNNFRINF